MPFTPEQKARIKEHLSYPVVGSYDALRAHGVPVARPLMNEMTHAIDAVLPEAEGLLWKQVERLDCIRKQIDEARGALITASVNKVVMNPAAVPMLWGEYFRERGILADMLASEKYHYAYLSAAESGGVVEPI